ncbi:uncharacterized protein LOC113676050 isoform X3 [Pocillopora damicornis]|uniref:uncharacterized protein LOC113676050 isoform X3 n=1 Tax=Pocillopora damicornis TaxID=46731 RepID=UPI000F54F4E0|nr:uncharacterized protein LOC113676050 isoform X3 [Pocillopora damicornis]
MPGYPVPEVDKEIFQELLCEYCDTVIRDAWRAECGHFYCRSCVEFLFRGNQGAVAYCRKCRTPLFLYQFLPDDIISSKVERTIIHCLFLEAGCKWEGELKESECHVGSCSLASIQRGEQKECEGDITLSTGTDDEREFLLSDNVVENQIGTEADEDPIDEDSHTQRPVPAHRQEAQDGENPQNSSPTRETATCPECGINTDSSELVVRDGARRSETRRSCHGGGNAIVRKKGHINANLPRQVNFLLSGNIAGQNRNSAENCLEFKEELNPSLNDTMARNTASSRNSVPNDSDQHVQRLINLENQVAHLTRCFSEQNEVTNYIANVNSHLVSENDQLKDAVGDVNNRLRHIQVSLNAHQMKHDDHQANFNTLQNEQSNQSVELARLIRDTAAVQERITRLEGRVNAQGTMLRNVSDSVRGLATLTRRVDIENL